ncbi:MAG: HD domain-containing protein, partial [Methylocella sp.]
MNDIVRIMKAAEAASRWHTHQRRDGEAAEPYMNHLLEVASLVAEATEGDPVVIIAALLHDAVEDQDVTHDQVSEFFGPAVAALVAEVTDNKLEPKQVRKHRQVENAPRKSPGASVIKLADKTSNLRAIANSPPPWDPERKRAYIEWAMAVVAGLPYKPPQLLAQFEEAVRMAAASTG